MSRPGSTHTKRQREQQRLERGQAKVERREAKKGQEPRLVIPGEDPDIAGIVPGPQPIREDE
jgi:hypothetical protein